MIRAIAFDIDNSLLDFRAFKEATAKAAAKAMLQHGLKGHAPRSAGLSPASLLKQYLN